MKFAFVGSCVTGDVSAHYQQVVHRVSDYLEIELFRRTYGPGVTMVLMGVNCVGPLPGGYEHLWRDFETGTVINKKYTKSQKYLDVEFKLNHGEVMSSAPDSDQMVEILKRGVLATCEEVKAMGIKDFDVDAFYRDIGTLIDERGWIRDPEKYEKPPYDFRRASARAARQCPRTNAQEDDQMDFRMDAVCTPGNVNPILVEQVAPISNCLAIELSAKKYGSGVAEFVMNVWCNTPGNQRLESHFNDYSKRYYDYGRVVFWDIKLDHAEVTSSDEEQFAEILKRGIMDTAAGVKALGIKDFDVDVFYRDVAVLLDERGWIKNPEKYRTSVYRGLFPADVPEGMKRIPKRLRMPEADFWNLIQQSIEASDGNVDNQLAYLEDSLATKSEKEIVGFELTLRELIRRSYHHNVVALLKVIEGMVTDDPLLYFRCRLILYGRDLFHAAIDNPNKLTQRLDSDGAAELLLNIADRAFVRKFGENTDKDMPRDVGAEYVDYNTDNYPERGRPWTKESFAKRYAALLKLYEQTASEN